MTKLVYEPQLFKLNNKLFPQSKIWFARYVIKFWKEKLFSGESFFFINLLSKSSHIVRQLSPEFHYWGDTTKQLSHVTPMLANSKLAYQNGQVVSNLDEPVQLMNQKLDKEGA